MREFTDRIFRAVLNHRAAVLIIALVLCVLSAVCIPAVKVNYQFADYLPQDSPSTIALDVMNESFKSSAPNARMSVDGLSVDQAKQLAERIDAIEGASGVIWLGTTYDISQPLEIYDAEGVATWKNGDSYFYRFCLDTSIAGQAIAQIRQAAADLGAQNIALAGDAVNSSSAQESSGLEIEIIMVMAVIVILGLLMLTSRSWFEPVLFLAVIGMSIVFNLGSNIIFGEIGFITQMCAAILQLAVSMDYGIVMLHAFRTFREEGLSSYDAALASMHKASGVIASSAATTFFGFLALCVMAFLIGQDMGVVLAKGIVFSFLSVLLILPVLILIFEKALVKTEHRMFLPSFDKFARVCLRLAVPFTIIIAIIVVPVYLAQGRPNYEYGASSFVTPGSQLYEENQIIEERFGADEQWVLLIPAQRWGEEKELDAQIANMQYVKNVTSYTTMVSEQIPMEMVPGDSLKEFVNNGYSRVIISTTVPCESPATFNLIQEIRDAADSFFPGQNHLVGSGVTSYDISQLVTSDSFRVLAASIGAITLILLIMFRSISIPILLVLSIEISIWINLAIPYFLGTQIQYIGYLIISAIMLGATVDYTIILTKTYLDNRAIMEKRPAMIRAISDSAVTILTSATILTVCGALIGLISSNGVISGLGTLIGRGAFIAALDTFLLLPMLFLLLDRVIEKTTWKARFFHGEKDAQ